MFSSKTFTALVTYFLLTNKYTCDQCDGGQHDTASEGSPNSATSFHLDLSSHRRQQSECMERKDANKMLMSTCREIATAEITAYGHAGEGFTWPVINRRTMLVEGPAVCI